MTSEEKISWRVNSQAKILKLEGEIYDFTRLLCDTQVLRREFKKLIRAVKNSDYRTIYRIFISDMDYFQEMTVFDGVLRYNEGNGFLSQEEAMNNTDQFQTETFKSLTDFVVNFPSSGNFLSQANVDKIIDILCAEDTPFLSVGKVFDFIKKESE